MQGMQGWSGLPALCTWCDGKHDLVSVGVVRVDRNIPVAKHAVAQAHEEAAERPVTAARSLFRGRKCNVLRSNYV